MATEQTHSRISGVLLCADESSRHGCGHFKAFHQNFQTRTGLGMVMVMVAVVPVPVVAVMVFTVPDTHAVPRHARNCSLVASV